MSNPHLLSQSLAGADNPGLGTANTQMGQGAPVATLGFNPHSTIVDIVDIVDIGKSAESFDFLFFTFA